MKGCKRNLSEIFVGDYRANSMYQQIIDFYTAFGLNVLKIEVLLGVCEFEVNIRDNFTIFVLNNNVKKMIVFKD